MDFAPIQDKVMCAAGTAKEYMFSAASTVKHYAIVGAEHAKVAGSNAAYYLKEGGTWFGHKFSWFLSEAGASISAFAKTSWQYISFASQNAWNSALPYFAKAGQFLLTNSGLFAVATVSVLILTKLVSDGFKDDQASSKTPLLLFALVAAGAAGYFFAGSTFNPFAAKALQAVAV